MANGDNTVINNALPENSFFSELYNRTTELPIKANSGNECISIDMRNCSKCFLTNIEELFENNPDKLRLLVRGLDYYVEVLNKDKSIHAYQKSIRG